MHIEISLTSEKDIILPIHYNNIVQAFIYNNIDSQLANFLHNKGFMINNRVFKLFTFSRLNSRGRIEKQNFNFGRKIKLVISSPLEEFCKSIANQMLQREDLRLGRNNIRVTGIEICDYKVENDQILITTLSPIVSYSTLLRMDGRKYTCYFMPGDPDFNRIVTENLLKKYNVFNSTNIEFKNQLEITQVGNVKQNIIYYKDFLIKGVSGKFIVKGDSRLLQIGLEAGFGSKNSQGFGCVKII